MEKRLRNPFYDNKNTLNYNMHYWMIICPTRQEIILPPLERPCKAAKGGGNKMMFKKGNQSSGYVVL